MINYFIDALNWWILPGIIFSTTFLFVTNMFAILDFIQPKWYIERQVSQYCKPLTFTIWFKIVSNNIRNIIFSWFIGWIGWTLRFLLLETKIIPEELTLLLFVWQIICCYVWAELWFWFSHWFVHQDKIRYKKIHSKHHEYTTPYAIVGLYCTIYEMLLINLPLSILMPIIICCHPITQSIWLSILATHIALNHSSHQLLPKWLDDVSYHAKHHSCPSIHYGAGWIEKKLLKVVGNNTD